MSKKGFRALRHVAGGVQRLTERPIADAYAANLFTGDLVTLNAGSVELAIATDQDIVGTFQGCNYVNAQGSMVYSPYWIASLAGATERYALISEDKGVSYQVQILAAVGAAVADVVDLATASAGSTKTGQSGMTAVATTSTANNLLVRKVLAEDVDINGTAYDILEVIVT